MADCNLEPIRFPSCKGRLVEASFPGGTIISDGGAVLLRQADRMPGLTGRAAWSLTDTRHQASCRHSLLTMVRQRPRRVIVKPGGRAAIVYDRVYCACGDTENRIKEQQFDLFADRTSCHAWWPNQYRLPLSAMAYAPLEAPRRIALADSELARAYADTIRLRLLKIGAIVLRNTRRVRLLLSGCRQAGTATSLQGAKTTDAGPNQSTRAISRLGPATTFWWQFAFCFGCRVLECLPSYRKIPGLADPIRPRKRMIRENGSCTAMTNERRNIWPYPGSRWWKFDFHTHTPASRDTSAWRRAKRTPNEVTPEKWLLKFMDAGIDCVAITDHNSGAWIDKLKGAYEDMRQQASSGTPADGFRELTLFPGVEISVNGGFHLLAILDPRRTSSDVDSLLGAVRYRGTKGDSDGVTEASAIEVVQAVLNAGGIPIPAHSDQDKGLLRVNPGTRESFLDARTVRQVTAIEELLAVEWMDSALPMPEYMEKDAERFAKVLGSDCHSFQGNGTPGLRYTWIKMANPSLEGLRLALLDGNGISVIRSDAGDFEPFQPPDHFVTSIEIESARFMGNGTPECLSFTPFCNALVGGRGTGKSTIIHALRLAYRRVGELRTKGEENEIYQKFNSFAKPMKDRQGDGALREKTEIRVNLSREGVMHRLRWRQDGTGAVVEEQNDEGNWCESQSSAVTAERFPIRLFSQGQIAAMAGESRQELLNVIDEGAGISDLHRAFEEAKSTYFSQQAQIRDMDGRLASRPELERKLAELKRKLEAFEQSHHSAVLKAHQRALRQAREVATTRKQLKAMSGHIESLTETLQIDDWPEGIFDDSSDQDILAWRDETEKVLGEARETISKVARSLGKQAELLGKDSRLVEWHHRTIQAKTDYEALQATLAEQGVTDPQAFGRLVQERQQFEDQLKRLNQLGRKRKSLESENQSQWERVVDARKAITEARREFVREALASNTFVRMEVIGFGFEPRSLERDLREMLDCQDNRFEGDILRIDEEGSSGGLAFELADAEDGNRESVLENIKQRLTSSDNEFGRFFKKFLQRKLERLEFADHVRCWFPDDDLRIEYSRRGDGLDWSTITQGSQGQRSAALLAFLLAFGLEPLVLDQPEDDLDNHLIYDLIVRQIRENKLRRQLIIVTHNPNVVVNGDAELIHALDFSGGQCRVVKRGALQENSVREEVCRVMEGGREAFARRWKRLGRGG